MVGQKAIILFLLAAFNQIQWMELKRTERQLIVHLREKVLEGIGIAVENKELHNVVDLLFLLAKGLRVLRLIDLVNNSRQVIKKILIGLTAKE